MGRLPSQVGRSGPERPEDLPREASDSDANCLDREGTRRSSEPGTAVNQEPAMT
jgi:hypothetical protein